jgi:hypothetical protein
MVLTARRPGVMLYYTFAIRGRRDVTADNPIPQVEVEALATEVTVFLEQAPVGEGIGVKLSNVLLGFLQTEVLPEARRESEQGVNPTPLFALVTGVLREYADAIERDEGAGH